MKITLLGTGSPTPPVKRAGSGYLVEMRDEVLIFDCGPCSYARFLQTGRKATEITHIFITHWHYDHCTDLATYLLQRWDQGGDRIPDLTVHGPHPVRNIVQRLFARDGVYGPDQDARTKNPASVALYHARGGKGSRKRLTPKAVEVKHGSVLREKNWTIRAVEVPHAQPWLQSVAYRLDSSEGSLVYSGDSGPSEALNRLAKEADVLIHMCHFLTGHKWGSEAERKAMETGCGSHQKVAETAQAAGVKTLVLTHITPQFDPPGIKERVAHEVSEIFQGTVIFGEDLIALPPDFGKPGELF